MVGCITSWRNKDKGRHMNLYETMWGRQTDGLILFSEFYFHFNFHLLVDWSTDRLSFGIHWNRTRRSRNDFLLKNEWKRERAGSSSSSGCCCSRKFWRRRPLEGDGRGIGGGEAEGRQWRPPVFCRRPMDWKWNWRTNCCVLGPRRPLSVYWWRLVICWRIASGTCPAGPAPAS